MFGEKGFKEVGEYEWGYEYDFAKTVSPLNMEVESVWGSIEWTG